MLPVNPGPAGALYQHRVPARSDQQCQCYRPPQAAAFALFRYTQRRQQPVKPFRVLGIFSIFQASFIELIGVILSSDTSSENWNGTEFISSSPASPYTPSNKTQQRAGSRPPLKQLTLGKPGPLGLKLRASAVPSRQAGTEGPTKAPFATHASFFLCWRSYPCEIISESCCYPPGPAAMESYGSPYWSPWSRAASLLLVASCSHQPPQKFNQTATPKEHNSFSVKILLQTAIFIAASINWKSCTAGMVRNL